MSTKPLFKTPYGERERNHVPSGDGIMENYAYEIDKFGRKVLVKTGETNLYEKIQENLEETKIENILKRSSIGDMTDFRPDGIYADLSNMPNNMIEARQAIQKMENMWATLPNEVKEKYNYDVGEFVAASGSEKWLRDLGLLANKETTEETITESNENVKEEKADE